MRYRIEYVGGKYPKFVSSRADLIKQIGLMKNEKIIDIRKLYKNGYSETVMEKYEKYM